MQLPRHALAAIFLPGLIQAQVVGSFTTSGTGCPNQPASSLYELFDTNTFDLNGSGLFFAASTNGYYDVLAIATPMPYGAGTSLPTFSGDDTIRGPFYLPFTFPYVGGNGQTSAIDIASNGYIYLEPGMITDTRCCNGSTNLADFHNQAPSIAVFGTDLDASLATGSGTIWWDSSPTAVWVTWDMVEEDTAPAGVTNTFQVQLFSDGSFGICYMSAANVTDNMLIGYSPGDGTADNGEFDFTNLPAIATGSFGVEPTLRGGIAVPTIGQSFDIFLDDLPNNAQLTALLFGASQLNIPLDPIGAESCTLLTSADILSVPMALTPPTTSLTIPIGPGAGGTGLVIETQAAIIAPPGVTTSGLLMSNRGTMTIGDTAPITIRAIGTNNFNSVTSMGFWRIDNPSTLDIVSIEFDWLTSSVPAAQTKTFDTDQATMADRFDGGNSALAGCAGTYRNGSDVTVGLDYASSIVSTCDAAAMTGFTPSNPTTGTNDYSTLTFMFNGFNPGETFEFDADTDGGTTDGGSMAGMVVTATFSDLSVRSGELVFVSATESRLDL